MENIFESLANLSACLLSAFFSLFILSEIFNPFQILYVSLFDRKVYKVYRKLMKEDCGVFVFDSMKDWIEYEYNNKQIVLGWILTYDNNRPTLWTADDCLILGYWHLTRDIYKKYNRKNVIDEGN